MLNRECIIDFLTFLLDFIRHECKAFIVMSPMYLTKSFMTLYTCLLDEIKGQSTAEGSQRLSSAQVSRNIIE